MGTLTDGPNKKCFQYFASPVPSMDCAGLLLLSRWWVSEEPGAQKAAGDLSKVKRHTSNFYKLSDFSYIVVRHFDKYDEDFTWVKINLFNLMPTSDVSISTMSEEITEEHERVFVSERQNFCWNSGEEVHFLNSARPISVASVTNASINHIL